MGSNDRGHQKLHGVEKRITVARRGHGTACVRGGQGRRGFRGCRRGMDGGNHGKPASTEMSLT